MTDRDQQAALLKERAQCRTTLVNWDDEASKDAASSSRGAAAIRELDAYLASAQTNRRDALEHWKTHKSEYPHLQLVACSVLGSSGSSASSERCFSVAGAVLRKERSRLLPRHLEMHCLIWTNLRLLPENLKDVQQLSSAERLAVKVEMDEGASGQDDCGEICSSGEGEECNEFEGSDSDG